MSGICGIYCLDSSEVDRNLVKKMADTIVHRGPEGEYFYFNKSVGLGCRLEANTFISGESHQLIASQDNSLIIVHDGHIYNYPEIREELERAGYSFRTNADAEVILNSYRQWGEDCLNRFNGMWAFAIWDNQRKKLFCARDRFGEKPFYFYYDSSVFVFASEIKAILEYPRCPRQVNEEAIYNYLMWGLFDYSGGTFFKDIRELKPSHLLVLDIKQGFRDERWWNLNSDCSTEELSNADIDYYVERFQTLLEDSVKLRIKPEDIAGIMLSGGLDSSTITALASKLVYNRSNVNSKYIGDKLTTLSTRFDDKTVDEGRYIDILMRGLDVERIDVFSNGHDLWQEFPRFMWHYDEPCSASSIYPRWNMMKKAKELGLKVILDGDGADALLAGHFRYYGSYFVELAFKYEISKLLSEMKQALSTIGVREWGLAVGQILVGIFYSKFSLNLPVILRNFRLRLSHRITDKILVPSVDNKFYKYGLARINEEYSDLSMILRQGLYRNMLRLDSEFRYSDRSSSAFHIEKRSPFLDYRLVEFSFALPISLKIKNGWTKWTLRQSMQGILPEQIRLQRGKLGFPCPLRTWLLLNRKNIKTLFCEGNRLSSQFINTKIVLDNFDELINYEYSARELWRYINLEIWLQVFFNRKL